MPPSRPCSAPTPPRRGPTADAPTCAEEGQEEQAQPRAAPTPPTRRRPSAEESGEGRLRAARQSRDDRVMQRAEELLKAVKDPQKSPTVKFSESRPTFKAGTASSSEAAGAAGDAPTSPIRLARRAPVGRNTAPFTSPPRPPRELVHYGSSAALMGDRRVSAPVGRGRGALASPLRAPQRGGSAIKRVASGESAKGTPALPPRPPTHGCRGTQSARLTPANLERHNMST